MLQVQPAFWMLNQVPVCCFSAGLVFPPPLTNVSGQSGHGCLGWDETGWKFFIDPYLRYLRSRIIRSLIPPSPLNYLVIESLRAY